jgi:hypothetical protein
VAALPGALAAQQPTANPLKLAPKPTSPEITAADLMSRLYVFADDSMRGRAAGTPDHDRGTDYIAAELKKLGLKPAGDNGSWFQVVPLVRRGVDADASSLTVAGQRLAFGTDFIFQAGGASRSFADAPVVFGGALGDTTVALPDVTGALVVVTQPRGPFPAGARGQAAALARYTGAVAVALVVNQPAIPPAMLQQLRTPRATLPAAGGATPAVPVVNVLISGATALLGGPVDQAKVGPTGRTVTGALAVTETPAPSRNVAAILEGRDAKLKGQYIVVGGHSDHVGVANAAVDHDSLKAVNWALNKYDLDNGKRPVGPVRDSIVKAVVAGLKSSGRRDSIRNGADDDGSGSMAVLEIAEKFAKARQKPRRSMLFLWYTGEEIGLLGSRFYTDNPTVARDSVVGALNIDMIGRGKADDMKLGGDRFLQLVGSRRLSTEMGDLVEEVNKGLKAPFTFDYTFDADGHPENIYCRSDHYNWARYGIPVTFFTTGLHGDYHQVTDEPQYIDYPHYAAITNLIHDVARTLADRDKAVVVDKPKPDPKGTCRQ